MDDRAELMKEIDNILYSIQYSENIDMKYDIERIADLILSREQRILDEHRKVLDRIKLEAEGHTISNTCCRILEIITAELKEKV